MQAASLIIKKNKSIRFELRNLPKAQADFHGATIQ